VSLKALVAVLSIMTALFIPPMLMLLGSLTAALSSVPVLVGVRGCAPICISNNAASLGTNASAAQSESPSHASRCCCGKGSLLTEESIPAFQSQTSSGNGNSRFGAGFATWASSTCSQHVYSWLTAVLSFCSNRQSRLPETHPTCLTQALFGLFSHFFPLGRVGSPLHLGFVKAAIGGGQ
jgi:hypothetical protein